MKDKEYLNLEKEGEGITMNKMQGVQGVLRNMFSKIVSMMFVENTVETNTISTRNEMKTSHCNVVT